MTRTAPTGVVVNPFAAEADAEGAGAGDYDAAGDAVGLSLRVGW
jgi:hypothetical protein